MPYIKQADRPPMDIVVDEMIKQGVQPDGKLNYVLFKFCLKTVQPGYKNYKAFCGELEECAAEIRRRFTAHYENEKIKENGDVS